MPKKPKANDITTLIDDALKECKKMDALKDAFNYHKGYIRGLFEGGRMTTDEYYAAREYLQVRYEFYIKKDL